MVELLVQIPAANTQLCMYTGRNTSDWILVAVVSNEDSHRGSHVCICSSSQETTDTKPLLSTSVQSVDPDPFTDIKERKEIICLCCLNQIVIKVLLGAHKAVKKKYGDTI